MDEWQNRFDGGEGEGDVSSYGKLIKKELPKLFEIAAARIKNTCSDPLTHREDVVQQGIQKFWRAARRRKIGYEDPADVLHAAVWQEGVRHSQTCPRERAVDFNELSPQPDEPSDSRQPAFNPTELSRKTSFNPTEIFNELLELKERLEKVTDLDLFTKYFMERRTYEEIAEIRGCSRTAVQRAVEKLKKELGILNEGRPPTPGPKS